MGAGWFTPPPGSTNLHGPSFLVRATRATAAVRRANASWWDPFMGRWPGQAVVRFRKLLGVPRFSGEGPRRHFRYQKRLIWYLKKMFPGLSKEVDGSMVKLFLYMVGINWGYTWRIIPVSKWLVTPIYKLFRPFGREQPYLGDLRTIVINHLLSGLILQVEVITCYYIGVVEPIDPNLWS